MILKDSDTNELTFIYWEDSWNTEKLQNGNTKKNYIRHC